MITQLAQRCETNRKLNKHKARENLFEKTNPKKKYSHLQSGTKTNL